VSLLDDAKRFVVSFAIGNVARVALVFVALAALEKGRRR
jgi:hypothetical protein